MRLPQSATVSPAEGRKRRNLSSSSSSSPQSRGFGSQRDHSRTRKKHKKLDAICEKFFTRNRVVEGESNECNVGGASGTVDSELRRSSRVRRAPVLLDASPSPVKKRRRLDNGTDSLSKKNGNSFDGNRGDDCSEKPSPCPNSGDLEDSGSWRSRLRSRAKNVSFALEEKHASPRGRRRLFEESDRFEEESKLIGGESNDKKEVLEGEKSLVAKLKRPGKAKGLMCLKNEDQATASSSSKEDGNEGNVEKGLSRLDEEDDLVTKSAVSGGNEKVVADDISTLAIEKEDSKRTTALQIDEDVSGSKDSLNIGQSNKQLEQPGCEKEEVNRVDATEIVGPPKDQLDDRGFQASKDACPGKPDKIPLEKENFEKVGKLNHFLTDTLDKPRIREGRRCGLCGGGTDGKPPKRFVRDSVESDNEAYGGSSASEEPNYDIWDGFGDEPDWLGRLLGPILDRFGIAGVWVHQHCAVWSPEVYFAGLGCLKNVRAALCRGKALKCSRCGRPGATIGCRVDRCPKTYHLPCARANGCIFDHKKFLIACSDHRHLFQPHGNRYMHRLKKMKARKIKLELKKLSHDAWRKDCEAEEKWLENCGEDEEFLKREGKRLHRDLLRIAPVYIGGSSESEKLYQGWESVAGLQDVIRCMKEVVILPLLYPEFFSTLGLTPPRGVLLHGYPGTGKTLVVRALIGACSRGDKRIAYFARKGADCLGKYVGDAERQLRLLFQVAERSQPSIIFFDEIDGLAPRRTRQQDQTHSSVVSTLLALMDGLKSRGSVIVIGATNRPEAVDPALRRPGRFDREIYFPLPSVKDRAAILSLHTQRWPKPVSGSLLKWVAKQTAGFAGADLQALCTQAAMVALKRNCALQELLSAAEEKANSGRRLPLPSFAVEERDWLDALACSPPPCSRREAGMAANDVVSSPLHAHLIPCLLQPLSHLLVSLYLDERLWLPPSLSKAAELIKNVVISSLEKKKMPSVFWWSRLHDLIAEADVAMEIERSLSCAGLLIGASGVSDFNALNDDTDGEKEKFDLCKLNHASTRINLLQNVSHPYGTPGFRILIAGSPRSGQKHLASCLLHGFMGNVEIQKVNLATISQEGRGDLIQGITHILLKCASVGLCVIYMPRIDLWSIETQHQVAEQEKNDSPATMSESDATAEPVDDRENAPKACNSFDSSPKMSESQAWNSFVEQVHSMCLSASFMILATSELPSQVLPLRIRQFFMGDGLNSNNSVPLEHSIPRFLVQVDGNFNRDMVVRSSAAELSRDLVQQYVQLIHQKTHTGDMCNEYKFCNTNEGNTEMECDNTDNGAADEETNVPVSSGRMDFNGDADCSDHQTRQHINCSKKCSPILKNTGHLEDEARLHSPQDSVPKVALNNRNVKGKSNLVLAILTFGYQILRYPHFSELCWATSKLKEGPCADISGPWKGWPFNSCIICSCNSLEKVAVGWSSTNLKDKENSGLVRGLIAVGLLAYKGLYSSVREVTFEVRKVLELLVGQVNDRIQGGKDRHRFLRLLSQVAYLEDMVNSWAYTLQSLELDCQMPVSNPRPQIVGLPDNSHTCMGSLVESYACKPNVSNKSSFETKLQEVSPQGFSAEKIKCIDSNKEIPDLGLPNTEVSATISKEEPAQQSCIIPIVLSSSSTADPVASLNAASEQHKPNHSEPCRSENRLSNQGVCGGFGSSKQSNGLAIEESILSKDGACNPGDMISSPRKGDQCNGLLMADFSLPSEAGTCNLDEHIGDNNSTLNKSSTLSAISGVACLYDCCSECLNTVHVLIQKIFNHEWDSKGSCWTVEDVHDVVASWSVNLLSAVRKFYVSESVGNSEKFFDKKLRHGYHGCQDSGIFQVKKPSCQCISSGNRVVMPVECICHSGSQRVTAKTNACTYSQFGLDLKFFIRDNVLVPADPDEGVLFHCKFQPLCLCSLIEWILMIKHPGD